MVVLAQRCTTEGHQQGPPTPCRGAQLAVLGEDADPSIPLLESDQTPGPCGDHRVTCLFKPGALPVWSWGRGWSLGSHSAHPTASGLWAPDLLFKQLEARLQLQGTTVHLCPLPWGPGKPQSNHTGLVPPLPQGRCLLCPGISPLVPRPLHHAEGDKRGPLSTRGRPCAGTLGGGGGLAQPHGAGVGSSLGQGLPRKLSALRGGCLPRALLPVLCPGLCPRWTPGTLERRGLSRCPWPPGHGHRILLRLY